MRAFKKLMAATIATAMAATMATSAFAAGFDADTGKVTAEYTAVGQTTVLIVPAENWVSNSVTALEDADILYINQYEDAATANTAVAAGFGVKLDETGTLAVGNYYALFGGNTGANGAFAITAVPFEVKAAGSDEPVIVLGDVDGDEKVEASDLTMLAQILAKTIAEASVTEAQITAGNVDKADGVTTGYASLTASDLTKLAKYLAKSIDSLE